MRASRQQRPVHVAPSKSAGEASWTEALAYIAVGAVLTFAAVGVLNYYVLETTVRTTVDRKWQGLPNSDSIARPVASEDALTKRLLSKCPKSDLSFRFSGPDRIDGDYLDLYLKKKHLDKMGDYINCSMTHVTERFCGQAARSDLAEQLRTYVQMRREMKQFAVGLQDVKPQGIDRVRRKHPHFAERYQQIDEMVASIVAEEFDEMLAANLRRLGAKGLFGMSAFTGWFTAGAPEELVPHLANDQQRPAVCN